MSQSLRTGALLLSTIAAVAASSLADARPRRDAAGTVSVCSRYGNGCLTAPTRPGQFNDRQVRLPGGTWIACRLDCRQTLREEALDFFETLNERAPDWR